MSFRRSWFDRFARSCFGQSARARRVGFRQRPVEVLEDRKYLSATVTLLNNGHTLSIVGDRSDNHIAITQDAGGVQVTADTAAPQRFTGIDLIQVEAGDGNDDIRVIYAFNPQPDPPADPIRVAELRVRLGAGNDSFNVTGQFPPDPCRIGVDAGAGNDDVSVICGFNPQPEPPGNQLRSFDFYVQLGAGNDRFTGNMVWPQGLRGASGASRVTVIGDAGNDSINALIGLLSNAMPAGDVSSALDLSLNGGDGNDSVISTLRNVNLNGRTSIDLQGGNGNDVVRQALNMVTVNGGMSLNFRGGEGDDTVAVTTGTETRPDAPPSLFVNSPVTVNVEGGLGNDRLLGLLQPCIKPEASLDVVFSGGSGNDVISILMGLEAGLLNPPSDRPASPGELNPPSEHDGPIHLAVIGGEGDDQLYLSVRNLGHSKSMFDIRLDGAPGKDTVVATPGIDTSGWTN